jgi:hypothetical protein
MTQSGYPPIHCRRQAGKQNFAAAHPGKLTPGSASHDSAAEHAELLSEIASRYKRSNPAREQTKLPGPVAIRRVSCTTVDSTDQSVRDEKKTAPHFGRFHRKNVGHILSPVIDMDQDAHALEKKVQIVLNEKGMLPSCFLRSQTDPKIEQSG